MSDYSVEDHIAYNMGFKAGQETQAARIAELEAALATARRDGMEEAAKIAENHSDLKGAELLKRFSQVTVARGTNIFTKREIAAAIRAALEGGKE